MGSAPPPQTPPSVVSEAKLEVAAAKSPPSRPMESLESFLGSGYRPFPSPIRSASTASLARVASVSDAWFQADPPRSSSVVRQLFEGAKEASEREVVKPTL